MPSPVSCLPGLRLNKDPFSKGCFHVQKFKIGPLLNEGIVLEGLNALFFHSHLPRREVCEDSGAVESSHDRSSCPQAGSWRKAASGHWKHISLQRTARAIAEGAQSSPEDRDCEYTSPAGAPSKPWLRAALHQGVPQIC